jgi:hypothetical protein
LPEEIRAKLVELALEVPELSPRELEVHFTHACPTSACVRQIGVLD